MITPTLLKSKTCYNSSIGGKGGVSQECCKRVYQFTLDGEFITSYQSSRIAAESLNIGDIESVRQAIKNNCAKRVQSAYGFFWSYTKKFERLVFTKPVAQYTLTGKFIRYYDSIESAGYELGINTIPQALKKNFSSGGYYWRYYNGDDSDIKTSPSIFYKNKVIPIVMVNVKTNECTEYSNVTECVKNNPDFSASQVNRVLKGIIRTHKGYTFKYKDEDIV